MESAVGHIVLDWCRVVDIYLYLLVAGEWWFSVIAKVAEVMDMMAWRGVLNVKLNQDQG